MKKAKLLFVEDDASLGFVTKESLELQDYAVIHCEDGEAAWKVFQEESFDACILDVMLPKLDGFSLAKRIREMDIQVPIIFLTAKSLQDDKITGLKLGGDDYIVKPFSVEELILRIEVFLKRSKVEENQALAGSLQIGNYEFDFDNLSLGLNGEVKQLTLREAEVLHYFGTRLNDVIKREDILKDVWGKNDYFLGRSLDVFITRLRKYLKADPAIKIENIPSVGFRMIVKA